MKPLLKTTLLAGAILMGGTAYADSTAMPSHIKVKAKTPAQLLFVLSAKSGNIARSGQSYRLTLNTVDPHVLWFTDRPNRKAGFVPLTHFLASWTKGFADSPPNGALVHVGMEAKMAGKNQPMAMELSKPNYRNGQLSFKVTTLKGDQVMVGRYNDLKLFFDMVDCFSYSSSIKQSECFGEQASLKNHWLIGNNGDSPPQMSDGTNHAPDQY